MNKGSNYSDNELRERSKGKIKREDGKKRKTKKYIRKDENKKTNKEIHKER